MNYKRNIDNKLFWAKNWLNCINPDEYSDIWLGLMNGTASGPVENGAESTMFNGKTLMVVGTDWNGTISRSDMIELVKEYLKSLKSPIEDL